jgi:hypothetical protein
MDNRQLLPDEYIEILEAMPDATHEEMGGLTVHTGTHPQIGEIVIVSSREQDAVLIHSGSTADVSAE